MDITITLLIFIIIILSIVLITRDMMIYNIRKMAIYLRWNTNVVGQLLGYATSTPELISAIVAGGMGMLQATIYNVISSNIVNIVFLLIVTSSFKKIKAIFKKKFLVDYLFVIISLLAPVYLVVSNNYDKVFAFIIILFIYLLFIMASKEEDYFIEAKEELELEDMSQNYGIKRRKLSKKQITKNRKKKIIKSAILLLISLVLLYVLGNSLGDIMDKLANNFSISGIILGAIMGVLTSIPELVTYISSYKRHRRNKNLNKDKGAIEAVKNLVTSNISNLCIIYTTSLLFYFLLGK